MPDWAIPALSIAGAITSVVLLLIGVIWRTHESHDRQRDEALWYQIGRDSDKGMRKIIHDTASTAHGHGLEICELQRRVEHLERKVFNGHRESER